MSDNKFNNLISEVSHTIENRIKNELLNEHNHYISKFGWKMNVEQYDQFIDAMIKVELEDNER